MSKRMSDDEIMDYTYNKLFGDLDGLQSDELFKEGGEDDVEGKSSNAASSGLSGIKLTIEPMMAAAQEGGRASEGDDDEDEEQDKLKGIGGMSPLMQQLHGKR